MIAGAQAELLKRTVALLERERLISGRRRPQSFSTPRRLAVLVPDVAERQPDLTEELLGPAAKIAYKDGVPGPAAIAFAKKVRHRRRGPRDRHHRQRRVPRRHQHQARHAAAEVLAAELPKELAAIYWAKSMYWRAGKPERFVRPVRWLLALLGHRRRPRRLRRLPGRPPDLRPPRPLRPEPSRSRHPADYAPTLTEASVIADVEVRRQSIRKALDRVCRTLPDTRWREDHALVDKMTHMTEWPSVIAGSFDPTTSPSPKKSSSPSCATTRTTSPSRTSTAGSLRTFLPCSTPRPTPPARPSSATATSASSAHASTTPASSGSSTSAPPSRPRRPARQGHLPEGPRQLRRKVRACRHVCRALARKLPPAVDDPARARHAARLAKTDLTSELVKEFTELQGKVGGLYARAQGIRPAADAIYDQYRPASMEDRIPRTPEGQLLAIADKADTIAGMFALGMEPTGSKDPFALRRAANGIVKILAESRLPIRLGEVVSKTAADATTEHKVATFLNLRLQSYMSRGQRLLL